MFYNNKKSGGCWILSNLVKHIENTHNITLKSGTIDCNEDKENVESPTNKIIESAEENIDSSLIIIDDNFKNAQKNTHDDHESLFTQLSSQITNVMTSVLQHNEQQEETQFELLKLPRSMTVTSIPGDGSCLFSALAHQLWMHKIGSPEHIKATKQLRMDVVNHILKPENFTSFEFSIQDRVYGYKNRNEITDLSAECKIFVRHILSHEKTWGGYETLVAVSDLYMTNVIVVNENGPCLKFKRAGQQYDRSIIVAYRYGFDEEGQKTRNHYDSVSDINTENLYTAAGSIVN